LSDNTAGKPVLQILADFEDYRGASGETDSGYMSRVIFDPDAKTISVKTFSPTEAAASWLTDSDHQYSYPAEFLTQVNGVASRPIGVEVADVSPPTPNPATFAVAPAANNSFSISMTATTGTDPAEGPVEYLFTETSGNPGATSSGWQTSPTYTNTALDALTMYTYTVTMRDSLTNTGTASAPASATTEAPDPAGDVLVLLDFEGTDTWTDNWDSVTATLTLDAPVGSTTAVTWVSEGELLRHWDPDMDLSAYSYLNFYMKVSEDPGSAGTWLGIENNNGGGAGLSPLVSAIPGFTVGDWFYASIPFADMGHWGDPLAFPADFSAADIVVLNVSGSNVFNVSLDYVTVSTTPQAGMLGVPEPSALIVLIMAGFLFRRSSAAVA